MTKFYNFIKDDSGATMIEYALLAALISVIAIVAITSVGQSVNTSFEAVDTAMNPAP